MVGAALLVPNNASAEKNELSVQEKAQKSSVQAVFDDTVLEENRASVHEKSTKVHDRTVVIMENTSNNQVRNAPEITPVNSTSTKKATALKDFPEKARSKVQSVIKQKEKKILEAPGLEKVTTGQKAAKGLAEKKAAPKTKIVKKAVSSLNQKPSKVNMNLSELKVEDRRESSTHLNVSKKMSSGQFITYPPKKESKVPKHQEEFPIANQVLNSSPKTNNSGGKSNDRLNFGLSSTSMVDKWIEWNKFYENNLILPYFSRIAMMSNQWMNAPPSPPPQKAPNLISITRP